MRSSEAIIGEYYKVMKGDLFLITKNNGPNRNHKGEIDEDRITGPMLSNMDNRWEFRENTTPWIGSERTIQLADWEERQWLDACILWDEFIPKDKIKFQPTYEIY